MIALSNIAQGSAVLGMIYLQKKNSKTQEVSIPACISCYLGVTEPAMFGVNLKYGFPFFSAMIGSCIAAVISVGSGVMANSIGVGGIPGILSIQTRYMGIFALAMLVAIAVPFCLTVVVGKRKLTAADLYGEEAAADNEALADNAIDLTKVAEGTVIPIEQLEDDVFSQKLMGEGIGIRPTGETIYAPGNGRVTVTMDDSKHAIGMTMDDGQDVLIHVGIDTVEMNGNGFKYLVNKDQHVKAGEPLLSFSKKAIAAAGKKDTVIAVVVGGN